LSFAFLALDIVRWASCHSEQEKGIGGFSVDEGPADAEPACPARFGQRPAFGKANKIVRYDLTGCGEKRLVDEVLLGPGCRYGQWPIIGSAMPL
jgi:hypothetical protein